MYIGKFRGYFLTIHASRIFKIPTDAINAVVKKNCLTLLADLCKIFNYVLNYLFFNSPYYLYNFPVRTEIILTSC